MPTVVPSSQIFQFIEDGAGTTPMSTTAASFIVHRQSDAPVAPQPYRGGFGMPPRPATAPPQQPQARPRRPSTPKVRSLLASTAPKQKYHGSRSDGMRELLEGRKAHPADPKSIDHRPPRPSASRRLARTTPHLPVHPPGHSAARPLDATGVATLHRQLGMVNVPPLAGPSSPRAPPQGAPGGPGWRSLPVGGGTWPPGARPPPRVPELAASKVAYLTAVDHPGSCSARSNGG